MDEAEAHVAPGIVDVQVHEDNGLPGSQGDPAPEYGEGHRRADKGGQQVIRTVAGRPVGVPVPVVAGQETFQRFEQIPLGAGACLHQGDTGGGVRYEDVDQPVTQLGAETLELGREVDDLFPRGIDIQHDRLHGAPILP